MAISRNKVKIYMVDASAAKGLDPALMADTEIIAGEIVSYSKTGGNSDSESVPAFGGFIDKEKPDEQFEISMEVVPNLSVNGVTRWEAMKYSKDPVAAKNLYTSAAGTGSAVAAVQKVIVIEATDGVRHITYAFNNCDITQFEIDHAADDNRTGNITFKLSPTTTDGSPNVQVVDGLRTALEDWASLAK